MNKEGAISVFYKLNHSPQTDPSGYKRALGEYFRHILAVPGASNIYKKRSSIMSWVTLQKTIPEPSTNPNHLSLLAADRRHDVAVVVVEEVLGPEGAAAVGG